ncbi:hypothetical protein VTI28DRAFT_5581 [Corynascus sepedonium]
MVSASMVSESSLYLAIEQGNKALAQNLLDHGAFVEEDSMGNLLVFAIESGDHGVIQLLMAYAPLHTPGRMSSGQMNYPLVLAISERQWELVAQLLQRGALANQRSQSFPDTPLSAAVRADNITLVQRLIQMGAEPDDQDALIAAVKKVDSAFLRLFLDELTDEKRSGERQALHAALYLAMDSNCLENFRLILQSGIIDVNFSLNGKRLLHHALSYGPWRHRLEFVRLVLEAGASLHTVVYGFYQYPITALMAAIGGQSPDCVKLVLEKAASEDGDWLTGSGHSPLQLAAFRGNPEIVRLLLVHGQNPNIQPPPARVTASGTSNSQSGSKIYRWPACYELPEEFLLREVGTNPNTRRCTHTPLQLACRTGNLEVVERLIEYGADVNAPPAKKAGATALQYAAIGGYLGIAYLLLQKGANVNAEPAQSDGRTALEGAAEHGRIDMVQLLMNAGADISEPGGQYERALDRASVNGHCAVRDLLKSYLKS